MNNLLPYCELVDARISASEKDLPVKGCQKRLPTGKQITKMQKIVQSCSKIMTALLTETRLKDPR